MLHERHLNLNDTREDYFASRITLRHFERDFVNNISKNVNSTTNQFVKRIQKMTFKMTECVAIIIITRPRHPHRCWTLTGSKHMRASPVPLRSAC